MRGSGWGWAVSLALAHALLVLAFSLVTPYRQSGVVDGTARLDVGAPDERAHANYIGHLLKGRGFPVLNPTAPDIADTFQSHQPPLYYLLAAGWAKLVGVDDIAAPDGRRIRWLGMLLGFSTVLGAFAAARAASLRPTMALGAASIVAFLPMECAVQGAITNDGLVYALSAWAIFAMLRHAASPEWRTAVLSGFLVGLALLTKSSALGLLAPLVVAGCFAGRRWRVASIAAVVTALLIALPWWLRNHAVYGDWLATAPFYSAFPRDVNLSEIGLAKYGFDLVRGTSLSFVGIFGYMSILLPWPWYVAAWAGFGVLLLGWARRRAGLDPPAAWVVGTSVLVAVALFLRFNLEYFQPQARYVLHVLPALAIGMAIGAQKRFRAPERSLAAMATLLLVTSVTALTLLPAEFATLLRR